MTNDELIDYCSLHCTTQRALFNGEQINRMVELAGMSDTYGEVSPNSWASVHGEMAELVSLARARREQGLITESPEPPEDSEDLINDLIDVIWPRLDAGTHDKEDIMCAIHNVMDAWTPKETIERKN